MSQIKLNQIQQDGAALDDIIKWDGSKWTPGVGGGGGGGASFEAGITTGNTGVTGEIVINHTLGTTSYSAVCTLETYLYLFTISAKTSTSFTLTFYDDPVGFPILFTDVTINWIVTPI